MVLHESSLTKIVFIAALYYWIALDCAGVHDVLSNPLCAFVHVVRVEIIAKQRLHVYALVYYWDPFQKSLVMLAYFLRVSRKQKERSESRNKGQNRRVGERERQREKEAVGKINS